MLLLMMFGAQSFALGFDPACGHEESPICAHCAFLAHSGREQDVPLSTAAFAQDDSSTLFPHHDEATEVAKGVGESPEHEIALSETWSWSAPIIYLALRPQISRPPTSRLRVVATDKAPRGPPSLPALNVAA